MLPKGLLKEYSRPLSILLRVGDVFAVVLAGFLAYVYKFEMYRVFEPYQTALWISAGLTLLVFPFFHIYESVRAKGFWTHLRHVIQATLAIFMLMAGLAFLTKSGESFSRAWFMLWAGCALGLLLCCRFSLLMVLRLMRSHGWNERRVAIVGAGTLGIKLAEVMQQSLWTGFRIVVFIDDAATQKPTLLQGIPVIQTPADMGAYMKQQGGHIDEVWLALPLRAEMRAKEILHDLRHHTVTTRFVLDIFGMDLLNHSIADLAGFPVLNIRSTPMMGMNRVLKAIEDRVLAALILLLLAPLLGLIAIAVKCSSKGPVFFRQKRISWNGTEFDMLKFRTMPVDAEATTGPVWATANENRATVIGKILRRTSLDELPQFINVLLGDMSIVGPRPERLVFVEKFKDQIPRYMQKHLVKAGITGWAQVNGWRGNTSLEKRIEYDLYYIENWSLALDIKIIFLTLIQGFIHKNAY